MLGTTIKYQKRNVYGKIRMYITTAHREPISFLTGSPSITLNDIKALQALGFTVEEEIKPE